MMAAAEARAVWQRAANRCFVQEDAKRAPKLACCQSSSSQSKPVDGGPAGGADMPDHRTAAFPSLHRNPSYTNLSPDTRWWLQLQPNYGYQKGQGIAAEAESENLRAEVLNSPSKTSEDKDGSYFDGNKCKDFCSDVHLGISVDCVKKEADFKKQGAKTDENTQEVIEFEDAGKMPKLIEMDPIGFLKSHSSNEYGFDADSHWIGNDKNVPWWRTTDKDDLASLVAQKSLDYMENCDLPPPQKMHVRRHPSSCPGSSDLDDVLFASLNWKAQCNSVSSPIIHQRGSHNSDSMYSKHRVSIEEHPRYGSDKPVRDVKIKYSCATTHEDCGETGQVSKADPCKAQLLEALRHSQTRAREAEKVAKQACAEKEHIVKLFFRQASQLFAYKQWFQLLQLETLYHQMKNRDQPMSNLFPVVLPWMPYRGRKLRKNCQKSSRGKRGKRGRPRPDISKYAVAFALGLSLVGAGLLLGWTVGWMLPF